MKALLAAGADAEARDRGYEWTALRHARAIEHDVNRVESLLQPGGRH